MQFYLTVLLIAAICFTGTARARCSKSWISRGHVHALCTDEDTGYDFELIDFDDKFLDSMIALSVKSNPISMRAFHAEIYNRCDK